MEEFKQMAKKKEATNGELMAKEIIAKYKPKTVEDMQNALKDIFGPMFEAMLTDRVLEELNEWQNRPLKKVYPFVFVDCMYVTI
mgnify:CR=1 FL=1